jgi:hypothetical protein
VAAIVSAVMVKTECCSADDVGPSDRGVLSEQVAFIGGCAPIPLG